MTSRLSFFPLLCLPLLLASGATGATWTVGPGQSIQAAIDSSAAGDTVLVSPGTYQETINYLGKDIWVESVSTGGAVIDGASTGGTCVTFQSGEGPGAVLKGFTLTGGTGTLWNDWFVGGGVLIVDSEPTILNNWIRGNDVRSQFPLELGLGRGGGIMCIGVEGEWRPTIRGNSILDNSADFGGGIGIWDKASPVIAENTFEQNVASFDDGDGGGIWFWGSAHELLITENSFQNCTAKDKGGGIFGTTLGQATWLVAEVSSNVFFGCKSENASNESGSPISRPGGLGGSAIWMGAVAATIESNSFVQNNARFSRQVVFGTLAFEGPGDYTVRNNIVANTVAGGGVACDYGPALTLANNLFWANVDGDISGHPELAEGNLFEDPFFCDPGGSVDPTLAENSPALLGSGGVIGARPIPGCESVNVSQATWGTLKLKFE